MREEGAELAVGGGRRAAWGFWGGGEAVLQLVLGPGWRQRRLDRPCVEGRVGGHGREARPQCTREAGVGHVPGKPRDLLGVSGGQSSWAQAAIQL